MKPASPPTAFRLLSLDAVRGMAILLMCLNGVLPAMLPNWMYHGYEPRWLPEAIVASSQPATELSGDVNWVANPKIWPYRAHWPGFTIIDWVFPGFLFAMGAAIPLALSRAAAQGRSGWSSAAAIVWRFLGLVLFAVLVSELSPSVIEKSPGIFAYMIALVGFLLFFGIYARVPASWSTESVRVVRILSITAAAALVMGLRNRTPMESWTWRYDIIILLLAHMYLAAALLWLVTRHHPWLRAVIAIPLALIAHHQSMDPRFPGFRWASDAFEPIGRWLAFPEQLLDVGRWFAEPLRGLLNLAALWDYTWYKYLWIVIPGTMLGDAMLKRSAQPAPTAPARSTAYAHSLLALATIVLAFIGLRNYHLPTFGTWALRTPWLALLALLPLAIGAVLIWRQRDRLDPILRLLHTWGATMLVIGLFFALLPSSATREGFFEGGISKDPEAKLAYYFVSSAMSVLLWLIFAIHIDLRGSKAWSVIVANGQNPLIAYVGIRVLVPVIFVVPWLTPFASALGGNRSIGELLIAVFSRHGAWVMLLYSILQIAVLGCFVAWLTRRKVVWKT